MRVLPSIMLLAAVWSAGCHRGAHGVSPAPGAVLPAPDEIKVNPDGTAKATGIVLENVHACEVDARCFLRLQVGKREIDVTYAPAEGEQVADARKDIKEEWDAKKGDHVEVYGKYKKDHRDAMETYSSDSYYVHILRK